MVPWPEACSRPPGVAGGRRPQRDGRWRSVVALRGSRPTCGRLPRMLVPAWGHGLGRGFKSFLRAMRCLPRPIQSFVS